MSGIWIQPSAFRNGDSLRHTHRRNQQQPKPTENAPKNLDRFLETERHPGIPLGEELDFSLENPLRQLHPKTRMLAMTKGQVALPASLRWNLAGHGSEQPARPPAIAGVFAVDDEERDVAETRAMTLDMGDVVIRDLARRGILGVVKNTRLSHAPVLQERPSPSFPTPGIRKREIPGNM